MTEINDKYKKKILKDEPKKEKLVTKSVIAKATGLKPVSILYYLDQKLINTVKVSDSGYQYFDKEETVNRIKLIKELQENNFSIDEIVKIFREKKKQQKELEKEMNSIGHRKWVTLGDVAKIERGADLKFSWTTNEKEGPLVIISRLIFENFNNFFRYLKPKYEKRIAKKHFVKKGDILIPLRGGTRYGTQVVICEKKLEGAVLRSDVAKIKFVKDIISPEFLKLYLENSSLGKRHLESLKHGRTLLLIHERTLDNLEIPVLSEDEEKKVQAIYNEKHLAIEKYKNEIKDMESTLKEELNDLLK